MKTFNGAWYYISSSKLTVGIMTDASGILMRGPPIVRKFMGQKLENLIAWLSKFKGGVKIHRLGENAYDNN